MFTMQSRSNFSTFQFQKSPKGSQVAKGQQEEVNEFEQEYIENPYEIMLQ